MLDVGELALDGIEHRDVEVGFIERGGARGAALLHTVIVPADTTRRAALHP